MRVFAAAVQQVGIREEVAGEAAAQLEMFVYIVFVSALDCKLQAVELFAGHESWLKLRAMARLLQMPCIPIA